MNVPAMPAIDRRWNAFGGNIMRIGSLASAHRGFVALFVAATTMATVPMASFGQVRNASYATGSSSASQGARQALYTAPSGAEGYGDQMVRPAGYCQQCGD